MSTLQQIQDAYANRDLALLDSLVRPLGRVVNTKQHYASVLMLSCNNIKHLQKIDSLQADCIMFNLEDGVSKQEKPFALRLCGYFLSKHQQSDKKFVVRVNALDAGGIEEIKYLNKFYPDAIRVPKINNQNDVKKALKLVQSDIELHLSIETASGWLQLQQLRPDERVKAFYLGILDLFADMKLPQSIISQDNPTVQYVLAHFLLHAKALGVKPVSFVYQEYKNLEAFSNWLELEKSMGFDAKGCISPQQVKLANEMFRSSEASIARAKEIVVLFEKNLKQGITGFTHSEYGFIDEPIYKGALAILEKI